MQPHLGHATSTKAVELPVAFEAAEHALHRNALVVDRLPFGRLVRKRAEPLAVVVPEGPVFGGLVFTLVAVIVDVGIYASQGS